MTGTALALDSPVPNNTYGYGQIDVRKAYDQLVATAPPPVAGVSVSPPASQQSGAPATSVVHTLQVTNTGNASDSFSLNVPPGVPNGWTMAPASTTVGPLPAGGSAFVTETVTIPAGALNGDMDTATLTATSVADGTKTASATLTTKAVLTYGVTVLPTSSAKQGARAATVGYTVTVTNTGNVPDTFNVAISGNTWTTTAPSTVGPLAPSASSSLTVNVSIPASPTVASNTATVTLTSQHDSTKSSASTLTTTVLNRHIGNLDGTSTVLSASQWRASVVVTVHDTSHAPVGNATVSGTWSAGNTSGRTLSCVTNNYGQCTVTSGQLSRSTNASVNFTVGNVTGTPPYLAAANHDPDGSGAGNKNSNGLVITVNKP